MITRPPDRAAVPRQHHPRRAASARRPRRSSATPRTTPCPTGPGLAGNYVSNRNSREPQPPGRPEARRAASPEGQPLHARLLGQYDFQASRPPSPSSSAGRSSTTRRTWPSTGRTSSAPPRSTTCASAGARSFSTIRPRRQRPRRLQRGRRHPRRPARCPGMSAIGFGNSGIDGDRHQRRSATRPTTRPSRSTRSSRSPAAGTTSAMGGQWLHYTMGQDYASNSGLLGSFAFNGGYTGFGFADFLLDQVGEQVDRRRAAPGPSSRTASASSSRTTSRSTPS